MGARASILGAGLVLTAIAHVGQGVPPALIEALPAEPIAVWILDAKPSAESADKAASATDLAALLFQRGREMGLVPQVKGAVGWLAESLAVLPDLSPYPRALVLLDIRADALADGGVRLSGIQAGIVVRTGGDHPRVERRIQAALNFHANSVHSHLTTTEENGRARTELRDDRLPDWAVFTWGPLDSSYVIAIGDGAWERLTAALAHGKPSLASDEWFRGAHRACRGESARWEWYVDVSRLRRALNEVMPDRLGEVLEGLRLGEVSRGLWTVGPDCRAVDAACVLRVGDRDRYIPLTVSGTDAQAFDRVVPPAATSATVIRARPNDLVERVRSAYLFAKHPAHKRQLREAWARMEAELGVKAQTEILDHLGAHVIIHDFPPHPLRLPIFRTVLLEIGGSADVVRAALDRLLGRAQAELRGLGADAPPLLRGLRLHRDADGVWYLQWGIYGPSLAVTDRWLVISHSPPAVRENVRFLEGPKPSPASQPASFDAGTDRE